MRRSSLRSAAAAEGGAEEEAYEEEQPQERVLRLAARSQRWAQSRVVVAWSMLLLVLRTADLSLSLAGTWRWQEGLCALAGVVLGVGFSVGVVYQAVHRWSGKLPLWAACACPGGLLVLGTAVLLLLSYTGMLTTGSSEPEQWVGALDLAVDEAARYVNPKVCNSGECIRGVAVAASFAQTLLVAGAAFFVVASSALVCTRRCKRLDYTVQCFLVIIVSLLLSVVLSFVRASYVAGGPGRAEQELPQQADFGFTLAVYLVTQAVARLAAPVCLLVRLSGLWGVTVVRPRCCRRTSRA